MKKNIYDLLNNTNIDLAAYDDAPLDDLELERMKKRMLKNRKPSKKVITLAAAISLCAVTVLGTAYASGLLGKAVDSIKLAHIQYEKMDGHIPSPAEIKEALENAELSDIFMAEGESKTMIEKDVDKLNDYLCFEVSIPTYLPEGYSFDRAEFYPDENGEVKDSKYISLYFTNKKGDEIFIQERLADEETGYEGGAMDLQEIQINGVTGILSDGHCLDWENNGRLHCLIGRKVDGEELIKIAETM